MYERGPGDTPFPSIARVLLDDYVPFADPILFFEDVLTVDMQARTFDKGSLIMDVLV